MARELSVTASRAVFVGDDERCDISGAAAAGMIPIRCVAWTPSSALTAARAVVDRLAQVPVAALSLLEEASNRHAA
jgi:FMN phosphatase YigB (HAD superfamily)